MQLNHLPENIECSRVFKNKVYFQNAGITCFYEFEDERQADEWRQKRSLQNRKEMKFEYFMACNDAGEFDYLKLYKLIVV